ncbi:MAG: hypothetical protein QXU87_09810 [Candidatus Caldarchaeum sp.]|uniref:Dipeptidylpeptidase IV N-terminal domain-containing protein n=1 Tax=Caldiarchaeum subterraneum TaxID=311458 RepID=A0A7C5LDS2_CALS0
MASQNQTHTLQNKRSRALRLAIYDVDSGSFAAMGLSKYGVDFTDYGWFADGSSFWFVARKNERSKLYVCRNTSEVMEVETPAGTVTGLEFDRSSSFTFTAVLLSTKGLKHA